MINKYEFYPQPELDSRPSNLNVLAATIDTPIKESMGNFFQNQDFLDRKCLKVWNTYGCHRYNANPNFVKAISNVLTAY